MTQTPGAFNMFGLQTLTAALVALAAVVGWSEVAFAQACTLQVNQLAFGTVASRGRSVDTTATLSASCTGMANQVIELCPSVIGTEPGLPGGQLAHASTPHSRVRFVLYADAAHTVPWREGLSVALNSAGVGSVRRTIYGRMFTPAQGVKGGHYQASILLSYVASYAGAGAPCTPMTPTVLPALTTAAARGGAARTK